MDPTIGPYAGSTSTLVLGVDEQSINNNSVSIYPIPTQNHVTIIVNEKSSLSIYNNLGKKISESIINSGTSKIELKNYSSGIYFFKITNKQGVDTKKVIVD